MGDRLWRDLLGTLISAVVLCQARVRFGSLWVPMLVHAVNNLIAWLWVVGELALFGTAESTLREFQDSWWLGLLGIIVGVPLLAKALRSLPPLEPKAQSGELDALASRAEA